MMLFPRSIARVASAWLAIASVHGAVPAGVAASDWTGIRAAREVASHLPVTRPDGSRAARNSGQQWTAVFDGRGFTVTPDHGAWSWGLELVEGGGRSFGGAGIFGNSDAGRIEVRRDADLTEWFVNDARGLEQGWTFRRRPAAAAADLELGLAVRGGLAPRIAAGGDGLEFLDPSGAAVLRYGGLKAWDADGKTLPARFVDATAGRVRIRVDDANARYPVTVDPVAQQVYLKASNTGAYDNFGHAVAISGDTAVVGAPSEGSGATGINGNQADESAASSGAAYVFVRNAGVWTQQAYLKPSNTGDLDQFGWSVAISGDTIVVGAYLEDSEATGVNGNASLNGAPLAGAAYVFVRSAGTWTQQAYLKASNTEASDLFGAAVAVSGNTIVVGANRESSAATGVGGSGANNSAPLSGAAYVFFRSGAAWTQQAYLKASDTAAGAEFGSSVGISGETVVVGAPLAGGDTGAVHVFTRSGATWSHQAKLLASNAAAGARFGFAVGISGESLVAGARGEGSAATGVNGNPAVGSAPDAGAAYVFTRSGTAWSQQAYLKASNTGAGDGFGEAVAIDGETVVVGAFAEDGAASGIDGDGSSNAASAAGAAYVFSRSLGTWYQAGYLKASNCGAGDWFGGAVAVSGDTVLAGAPREAGGSSGINGAQGSNAAAASGAGYAFLVTPPAPPEIVVEVAGGPELSDGAGLWDFGSSATGHGITQALTVRNTGSGPLLLTGQTLGGAQAASFALGGGLPSSIAAGGQATLWVQFGAPTDGGHVATLQLACNDADEALFDIALSATAQLAATLYQNWAAAAGLIGPDASPEAVAHDDGVANLLKYAFHLDGAGADVRTLSGGAGLAGLPEFKLVGSGAGAVFRAEYLRRKGSGLGYLPEVSASLAPGGFAPMTGSVTVIDLGPQWERVRVDQPRNPAVQPKGFGRLVVELP
jgi:hypothetical protein